MAGAALGSSRVEAATRVADLHARYGGAVYRYCRRQLRSHEDAEDAVQTVFLNAQRGLARGADPQFDAAWLFKIAENVVLYRRRAAGRRERLEFPVDADAFRKSAAVSTDPPGAGRDLVEALARVPLSQRRAIVLREWQGLPYRSIAAELDVSVAAAANLVVRGRRALAAELERPAVTGGRRRLGLAWLLAPFDRLAACGVAVKTAAGMAGVIGVAVPLATSVAVTPAHAHVVGPAGRPAIVHVARFQPVAYVLGRTAERAPRAAGLPHAETHAAAVVRVWRVSRPDVDAPSTAPDPPAAPDAPAAPAAPAPTDAAPVNGSAGPVVFAPADASPADASPAAVDQNGAADRMPAPPAEGQGQAATQPTPPEPPCERDEIGPPSSEVLPVASEVLPVAGDSIEPISPTDS